jgi:hypothetical protein
MVAHLSILRTASSTDLPRASETKKRQPPVPIPPRLLAHLRRWRARGTVRDYVVEWNGEPIKSVKTAFKSAVAQAGLDGKVHHTHYATPLRLG